MRASARMPVTNKSPVVNVDDGMQMERFNFDVVDATDSNAEVPIAVAGQIMVDIQNLLTHTGELMVRQEFRTQNKIPAGISDRFSLRMQGHGGASTRKDGQLIEDALSALCDELDRANLGTTVPEETSNHIEARGRMLIAKDVLALADHLEGYTLSYGPDGYKRKFRMNSRTSLEREASFDIASRPSAIIGTLSKDPVHKNRWLISNGVDCVPVSFVGSVPIADIARFASKGPLIVTGFVDLGDDGRLMGLRESTGCYGFPVINFHRVITPERDILLLNPIAGCPGYNASKGMWTLSNEYLGINISKPSWDEAVYAFHEYFVFLWETYAESDETFEGEELEVREFLLSLAFP